MTSLAKMANRPIPVSRNFRIAFSIMAFGVCAYLVVKSWSYASHKTTKIEASDQRMMAARALDTSKTLGRIILDNDGKVVSWNAGMTALVNWTYSDMVGQSLERLMPAREEFQSPILEGIFKRHVYDWQLHAEDVMLKKKDGDLVRVFAQVHDVNGETGRFRFIYFDRQVHDPKSEETELPLSKAEANDGGIKQ